VVCDRLPVHKRARARALIEGAGCELRLLPSYSPDFNPIELAFAKISSPCVAPRNGPSPALSRPPALLSTPSLPPMPRDSSPTAAIPFPDKSYERCSKFSFLVAPILIPF
jgi:hypothetical protein